jgi:hypothetical protein
VHYAETFPRLKWKLYEQPPASFTLSAPELQPLFLFNVQPSHYFEWQVRACHLPTTRAHNRQHILTFSCRADSFLSRFSSRVKAEKLYAARRHVA